MSEHQHNTGAKALSRRSLLVGGASAVTALPMLVSCSEPVAQPPGGPALGEAGTGLLELTDGSAALSADTTVHGACQFCNCLCRLTIGKKAGRIIDIRGERADPVQAGNLCVKNPMMTQLAYNPLRLTTPLKRVSGAKGDPSSRFEPVSWDEALDIVAGKFLSLRDQGEARAIANRTSGRLPCGTGSLVALRNVRERMTKKLHDRADDAAVCRAARAAISG